MRPAFSLPAGAVSLSHSKSKNGGDGRETGWFAAGVGGPGATVRSSSVSRHRLGSALGCGRSGSGTWRRCPLGLSLFSGRWAQASVPTETPRLRRNARAAQVSQVGNHLDEGWTRAGRTTGRVFNVHMELVSKGGCLAVGHPVFPRGAVTGQKERDIAGRLWWGLAGSVPSPVGGLMQTRRGATMTYLGADFAAVRVPRDRRR